MTRIKAPFSSFKRWLSDSRFFSACNSKGILRHLELINDVHGSPCSAETKFNASIHYKNAMHGMRRSLDACANTATHHRHVDTRGSFVIANNNRDPNDFNESTSGPEFGGISKKALLGSQ